MTTLFEVSAADVADTTDDWYTPRWIFDAAGLTFDMDVAAPVDPSRRTCPAVRHLSPVDDGLTHPWEGIVWCNPPYSAVRPWAERFAAHSEGLLLVPGVRSFWVNQVLSTVDAVTLLGDVEFGRPDGSTSTLRSVVILAAKGSSAVAALHRVAAADVLHGAGTVFARPGGLVVARQGNTTAVGLGYRYQQDRKRAIAAMPDGTPCPGCGRPMYRDATRNHDGRALHYDHIIPRALGGHDGPKRLTCSTCNMRAGQRLRTQLYRGRRTPRRGRYTRW